MSEELDLNLLREILLTHGTSGDEKLVVELLKGKLAPYVTSFNTDAMGNLTAYRKGTTKAGTRLMFSAHIDEIGLMVKHIESSGFLRVLPIGGIDPRTLVCQEFIVLGSEPIRGVIGTKPIHIQKAEDKKGETKLDDCLIDTGLTKEELEAKGVSIGTPVVRVGHLKELGPLLSSKSMDNRICVFALVSFLMQLEQCPHDLYCVFCTQEEVGLRGIRNAAAAIRPNIGINFDVGLAGDTPGTPEHEARLKLGEGTAIKLLDATSFSHRGLFEKMKGIALRNAIPFQIDACTSGGTDAAGMQYLSLVNCIVGGVSLPLRYMHSPVETVHRKDVAGTINLMKAIASDTSLKDLLT
ncbi:M42 family metallopeptidase [Candidatus Similichlamydia laticola]|uniref:Deblocking aminopeptidase n=1 Tax=Candidatus Similichlamydia laticola TaxID=2170265 RepID=A0A369KL33_9BACT|nr:M42 family peptidase [Candidatus Similichlamydia laticola]RDB31726.1 Deblocking aminopeptidase [Candidatus Similichlamydia laticola]